MMCDDYHVHAMMMMIGGQCRGGQDPGARAGRGGEAAGGRGLGGGPDLRPRPRDLPPSASATRGEPQMQVRVTVAAGILTCHHGQAPPRHHLQDGVELETLRQSLPWRCLQPPATVSLISTLPEICHIRICTIILVAINKCASSSCRLDVVHNMVIKHHHVCVLYL